MASFISTNETLERRQNGVISRTGGKVTNRVLEVAAGVDAGIVVCPSGTAGIACENCDSAADVAKALGVTVFRPMSYDADLTDGSPHYAENEVVAILDEGYIFVTSEGTVVAEAPVFVRITSDGGSNTTLGKVRGDSDVVSGGIVITPDASFAAAISSFTVVLSDGTVTESFTFTSDATPTTAEVAAGLVALIDASANFAATGTVTISVTSTTGIVEVVQIDERLPITTPARAIRMPNAYFAESRTGAGLVEIRVGAPNR
jgi:hypothetical protein